MSRRIINELDDICRIYWYSSKKVKSVMLNQLCKQYGCHRKSAIRKLNRRLHGIGKDPKARNGAKVKYEPGELLEPLRDIWLSTDQMCSKRLHEALPLWLPHYSKDLSDDVKSKLLSMSPATIDRLLQGTRKIDGKKQRCRTRPGTLLKNKIEIKTDNWDVTEPGFMEADTVAHCGNSLNDDFVWSLNMVDIYSGWTEVRAIWGKYADGVIDAINDIERYLPFILKGFDSDNGSEFINHELFRHLEDREHPVKFTRSRPYKKNDNAHVEGRNWTHVRQLMGYSRFDSPELVDVINELYRNEWSQLNNFFCPSMKIKSKTKINSRYQRKYFKSMTPFQWLLESKTVSVKKKEQLQLQFEGLNPFELRKKIEEKLKVIFSKVRLHKKPRKKI